MFTYFLLQKNSKDRHHLYTKFPTTEIIEFNTLIFMNLSKIEKFILLDENLYLISLRLFLNHCLFIGKKFHLKFNIPKFVSLSLSLLFLFSPTFIVEKLTHVSPRLVTN